MSATDTGQTSRLRLALGVLLVIATSRLTLVLFSAVEVPFYDAWVTTINQMALPLLGRQFDMATLFVTHNEHIFMPTRLVDLFALLVGDGQYNAVFVCVINQLLYAGVATALIVSGESLFGPYRRLFVVTATLYACLPYDFENVAQPLTSMYLFLLAFSGALLIVCARARTFVAGIAGIVVFGSLAALSSGGGFLAAIVAVGVVALRWRRFDLRTFVAMGFGTALVTSVAVGLLYADRAIAVTYTIAFVQIFQVGMVALAWTPTGLLAWRIAGTRVANAADIAAVAISIWGAMEIVAMIVARADFRIWLPISRYMEILGVAVFANIACLMRLRSTHDLLGFVSRFALPAFFGAVVIFAPYAVSWFALRAEQVHAQSDVVRRYVHDGNRRALDDAPTDQLAFPSRDFLRSELDNPAVRYVLGDKFGVRPQPSLATRLLRETTAFLQSTALVWWIGMASLAAWLLWDFFRSTGPGPREDELA